MSDEVAPSSRSPSGLAHAVRLMLTDASGRCVGGGLDEDGGELEVVTGDGRQVTIVVASSDRLATRRWAD